MGLFNRKNKEACDCCGCAANAAATDVTHAQPTASGIKVLGSGCAKCNALETATREALAELGMDTAIDHVTDFTQIAAYGVMSTPALVVDGKVLSSGRVLKKDEVKALIKQVRG